MYMQAVLSINLPNLKENYRRLQSLSETAVCAAVVKANAYGLGAAEVAGALTDCRVFFVAMLDEGIALRKALPDPNTHIYVLSGVFAGQEHDFLQHSLSPVLNSPEQALVWQLHLEAATAKNCKSAVHLDTGMARLGFQPADFDQLPTLLAALGDPLLMSHLCSAEEQGNPHNQQQLQKFVDATKDLGPYKRCFANSSGCFLGNAYHFDMLRPGVALYGGNPTPDEVNPMLPVVSLSAPLLQIRDLPAGAPVGYNETWVAKRDSKVGTLAFGYADGLLRSLHGKASLIVDGQAVPMIGRVSMDLVTVDLTDLPSVPKAGQLVEILGPHQSIDELASAAGTIGYEILTSLGQRYKRVYQRAHQS